MSEQDDNPNNSESKLQPTKKEAVAALYKKGLLWWKLNESQKDLYDLVFNSPERFLTFLCSRRFGKSYTLCVLAIETCLRQKNAIVKYLCPDAKQAKNIIVPIIRDILNDCPKALAPEYLKNDGKYVFPNGSEIQIAGNDGGRAESLRGGLAHLCIVDEAGFCDDLKYNVRSILFPTVSTTGGKIILSSTPPKTPGHEFVDFIKSTKRKNAFIKKTVFENPRFTPAEVQEIIDTYGGIEDLEFRREYLCELNINLEDGIIPEFTEALKLDVVKEWPRPPFFDYYVSMDVGFKDFTAILFAYYDFKEAKLIIDDEIVLHKPTTQLIADSIKEKEKTLLFEKTTNEYRKPFLRISDNNLFIINDLQVLHKITFLPTAKDDKEAAVNNVRILMGGKQIIINPKCVTLIKHLEEGVWKKTVTSKTREFDRSVDNGHFDTLDALIYLVRNVTFSKNPYPAGYGQLGSDQRFQYKDQNNNSLEQNLSKMMKVRKSL